MTDNQPPAVSGHTDPEGESPWAMQFVARVDKTNPPTRTDVCTATALAVLALLGHPDATGPWAPAIDRWTSGRIRKHVRRARGAAWDRVQALPGVTVTFASAEVRAFVPSPVDQIPADIAKLQLTGSELDDPAPHRALSPTAGGPMVISVRPDLPWGKAAAAAAHTAQIGFEQFAADRGPDAFADLLAHFPAPLVLEQPDQARWKDLCTRAPQVTIHDAGFTVVAPGTVTAVGAWA